MSEGSPRRPRLLYGIATLLLFVLLAWLLSMRALQDAWNQDASAIELAHAQGHSVLRLPLDRPQQLIGGAAQQVRSQRHAADGLHLQLDAGAANVPLQLQGRCLATTEFPLLELDYEASAPWLLGLVQSPRAGGQQRVAEIPGLAGRHLLQVDLRTLQWRAGGQPVALGDAEGRVCELRLVPVASTAMQLRLSDLRLRPTALPIAVQPMQLAPQIGTAALLAQRAALRQHADQAIVLRATLPPTLAGPAAWIALVLAALAVALAWRGPAQRAKLARIFHEPSTADDDLCVMARRAPSSPLDVVSTTPARSSGPRAAPRRHLAALATNTHEISGLGVLLAVAALALLLAENALPGALPGTASGAFSGHAAALGAALLALLALMLARISHTTPTADADLFAVARRAPSDRLDVVSTTPAPISSLRAAPRRNLNALATERHEKCGPARAGPDTVESFVGPGQAWQALLWPSLLLLALAALAGFSLGGADWRWPAWDEVLRYLLWAGLQQWLLQRVLAPRLGRLPAAMAFALLHLPNFELMLLTLAAAGWWMQHFQRHHSWLPLICCHALLGLALPELLPEHWLWSVEVGLRYLQAPG